MSILTRSLIRLAEHGKLPDLLIRMGIKALVHQRLLIEGRGGLQRRMARKNRLIQEMQKSPIAMQTDRANEQHYELPPAFFNHILGKHLKYSACYWPENEDSLDNAELKSLGLVEKRAKLSDGLRILELGCGWGAFALWAAKKFPNSQITAVSNASSQKDFIRQKCRDQKLTNVKVITADITRFDTKAQYDRVVSIEMFEHMRNWERLLSSISNWLKPDGLVFIHIFTHKKLPYIFQTTGESDWIGRYFFSGGMMPSDDLILNFQRDLTVKNHWRMDGCHYQKTAEAWLANLDSRKESLLPIMANVYGLADAKMWFQRWRIFFMACAELWGHRRGQEWLISHYSLTKSDIRGYHD